MASYQPIHKVPYAGPQGLSQRWARSFRQNALFFLFISPWLIGFLVFSVYPLLFSIWLSLSEWDIIGSIHYVGFENYRTIFTEDDSFWQSLRVTLTYTFISVPLNMMVSLGIALLLNQKIRGVKVWRTLFYLPSLISGVAVSLIWTWVFNPNTGIINQALSAFGINGPMWIYDSNWVMPALIIMGLWGAGGNMMILISGLQGIPTALYEAAELDGANAAQRLWHITVPMLSPVLFFVLIQSVIGTFQTFTQAYVMTDGGPDNASLFYVLYLFRHAFKYFNMGYASALAWILFLIILACTFVLIKTQDRWVHYESKR